MSEPQEPFPSMKRLLAYRGQVLHVQFGSEGSGSIALQTILEDQNIPDVNEDDPGPEYPRLSDKLESMYHGDDRDKRESVAALRTLTSSLPLQELGGPGVHAVVQYILGVCQMEGHGTDIW